MPPGGGAKAGDSGPTVGTLSAPLALPSIFWNGDNGWPEAMCVEGPVAYVAKEVAVVLIGPGLVTNSIPLAFHHQG